VAYCHELASRTLDRVLHTNAARLVAAPGVTEAKPSRDEILERVKDFLGDVSVPITLGKTSTWTIQECHAGFLSKGNV